MKIKSKIILAILFAAMLPLVAAMTVALWHGTEQLRALTIDAAQGFLQVGSARLSGYFGRRVAEMETLSRTPIMQTGDWKKIGPVLSTLRERYLDVYDKLIFGTLSANYYSTAGGNFAQGGLASFDDRDPGSRLKTLARRKYWQFLVGDNSHGEPRSYVSDPIISYTTDRRQILVGATILSAPDHRTLGLLAGTISWSEIESMIDGVRDGILKNFGRAARLSLVGKSGAYVYHWDPEKTVHARRDAEGNPILDEIGEKVAVAYKITDEPSAELARAGLEMIQGRSGFAFYDDPESGREMAVIYAPVSSLNYTIVMTVPRSRILASVESLKWSFTGIMLVSLVFVITGALLLAKRITRPIESLTTAARGLTEGDWDAKPQPAGSDEVGRLAAAFTEMALSLEKRELALKNSEANYRSFIQNLPIGIYRNTPGREGRFIIANPAIADMFGYESVADFMAVRVADLYEDPEERRTLSNHLLAHGRVVNRELRLKRKDGRILWGALTARTVRDENGRITCFEGALVDITERKHGEKALHRGEERYRNLYETSRKAEEVYRSLLNSSADAIVLYDMDGNATYVSPAFTRMFGWQLEEVRDRKIAFVPDSETEATEGHHRGVDSGRNALSGVRDPAPHPRRPNAERQRQRLAVQRP